MQTNSPTTNRFEEAGAPVTAPPVIDWVQIACPLCAVEDAEVIYERAHETGAVLGRLHKTDVLCRECGFMYTNPRPSVSDMRRYYGDSSGASGSIYHSMEPGSRLHRLTQERVAFMHSLIRQHLGADARSILDIGCALGDLLSNLELEGWKRAGLEPSKSASHFARERGLDVECGELETAEIAEGSYAVVSCISVLEHVWDLEASMKKIAESVEEGGLVFLEVPDSTRPVAQVAEFFSFEHFSHFTRGSLTHCLENAGLSIVAFDENVGLPNLRVCARRSPRMTVHRSDEYNSRAVLRRAVDEYVSQRRRLEDSLISELEGRVASWTEKGARVAIYGAGMHTRFLMELFDLSSFVECVLDSDPEKAGGKFLDWRVHGPDEIQALGLDAILISTNAFEQEVYDSLMSTANVHGIEVVRCYR